MGKTIEKALWSSPLANRLSDTSLTTFDSQANRRVLAANVDMLNVPPAKMRRGFESFQRFCQATALKDMRRCRVTVAWPVRHKVKEANGLAPTQAAPPAELLSARGAGSQDARALLRPAPVGAQAPEPKRSEGPQSTTDKALATLWQQKCCPALLLRIGSGRWTGPL